MAFFMALCLLALISVIDVMTYRIPDGLTVAFGLCGVAYAWNDLGAALCVVVCVLGLLIVAKKLTERFLKTVALGWGDVKLMPLCGFFFPLEAVGLFFLVTGVLGSGVCMITRQRMCPLGPAISVAAVVAHYAGDVLCGLSMTP